MSEKAVRRTELGQEAADFLASIGEHYHAENVRSVCRANATYRITLSELHKDNMDLRRRFGEFCAFCEMHISQAERTACKKADCPVRIAA